MLRTLEVVFRGPLRLFTLIVVVPVLAVSIAFLLPRTYQATASLWALQRYSVIGATGPESDLNSTPAQTQADALEELLQSRAFALQVANATTLPATLDASTRADPSRRDDALFQEISTRVLATAEGYNLYTVTYTNHSASLAQSVVQQTINLFATQSQQLAVTEGQRLLAVYRAQLPAAQQAAETTAAAVQQYLQAHTQEVASNTLANDAQYNLLVTEAQQAATNLVNLRNQIAAIQLQISTQTTGNSPLFLVQDPPQVPSRAVSRTKLLAEAGAAGVVLALLAAALYVIVQTRRDRALYTVRDVHKATGLPVMLQVPRLSAKTVSHSVGRVRRGWLWRVRGA
jgi:uncharacterized protein involved in exopolysaccharide biosynthesis